LRSTKQISGFCEVSKLVIYLGEGEIIEARPLVFRNFLKLLKCLLVLVLTVQDIGSLCHAVLFGKFVFVQEIHRSREIALFYQTCELRSLCSICLFASVNIEDLGSVFLDLVQIFFS